MNNNNNNNNNNHRHSFEDIYKRLAEQEDSNQKLLKQSAELEKEIAILRSMYPVVTIGVTV